MLPMNERLIEAIGLQNAGRIGEAVAMFREMLALDPGNAAALYSLGVIALNAADGAEALRVTGVGVAAAPDFAPMWFVRGAALQAAGRMPDALEAFDRALALQPEYIEVLINSGVLLQDMFRHKEALERFNTVLMIKPGHAPALANCGIILTQFGQSETAIRMFEALLSVDAGYDYGLGLLAYERLHICDWTDREGLARRIIDGVNAGQRACKTLALMAISDSARDHYLAAKTFAQHFNPRIPPPLWAGQRYRHERIRLAYVSPDLREHPVGHLMAGVFERHDKSRFELIAISLGIDDKSRLRARMIETFDHFIDAKAMGTFQIAQLMREMEVDIAVDLAGYTTDARVGLFANRPAPVQVNYLGYPGTLGDPHMDYILVDRHVVPPEDQRYYTEKVVYLPDSYLPPAEGVAPAEGTPDPAEYGLPAGATVFCAFSHNYKFSPPLFDVWMRLLKRLPGSVLWLMSRGELSQTNLRLNAQARGVDPARLIFAERVPRVEDHLARYRLADVFLDTHPYNAHTTAVDALMVGVPVVTRMGSAFPARVAGSLLHSMGMPDLIAHSFEEYEAIAFALASQPDVLAATKARIAENRKTCPLFDLDLFRRNLEAVYIAMWRNAQLGGAHDALSAPE